MTEEEKKQHGDDFMRKLHADMDARRRGEVTAYTVAGNARDKNHWIYGYIAPTFRPFAQNHPTI